jgi:hypothetical protein
MRHLVMAFWVAGGVFALIAARFFYLGFSMAQAMTDTAPGSDVGSLVAFAGGHAFQMTQFQLAFGASAVAAIFIVGAAILEVLRHSPPSE